MKVKRYVAPSSREAMAQVKKELGPDAVILSNRAAPGGVEILALAQDDVAGLVAAPAPRPGLEERAQRERLQQQRNPVPRVLDQEAGAALPLKQFAARVESGTVYGGAPASPARRAAVQAATVNKPAAGGDDVDLRGELQAMRRLVERQFASFAWGEEARRHPLRAQLMRELLAAGFSAPLGRKVSGGLPDDFSEVQARQWLKSVLARNLLCAGGSDNLVERGGVYALVGPTGVGKTTTVAKLAARCVVRFGAQKLALITTDSYRIGAQDQLRIYAKILGVAVHTVDDATGLDHALRSLSDKHLVLIDTVGMGQRDTRVAEQLAMFGERRVNRILMLNATSQMETLEDVVRAYQGTHGHGLAGAIITKLDESRRPGSALDVVMRHKLKLAFVTDGQRVPEDIRPPVAAELVTRALEGAGDSPFALEDAELMLLTAAAAHG